MYIFDVRIFLERFSKNSECTKFWKIKLIKN